MGSMDNLIPCKPGEGRKKPGSKRNRTVITQGYSYIVNTENPITGEVEEMTTQEYIVYKQIRRAMDGDIRSAQWLSNRFEGKPVDMKKIIPGSPKINIKEIDDRINKLLYLREKDNAIDTDYVIEENKDE